MKKIITSIALLVILLPVYTFAENLIIDSTSSSGSRCFDSSGNPVVCGGIWIGGRSAPQQVNKAEEGGDSISNEVIEAAIAAGEGEKEIPEEMLESIIAPAEGVIDYSILPEPSE